MTPAQAALVAAAQRELENDADIEAAWLAGSLGRGMGDAFSDVDILALVANGRLGEVSTRWARDADAITPIVYINSLFGGRVLNAITPDWQRFDLTFIEPAQLDRYDRRRLTPLFNRGRAEPPMGGADPYRTSPHTLRALVEEFIRVLGLAPVGIGRGEHIVALSGVELLRQMALNLMLEENGVSLSDRGGALRRNPLLTAEQRLELESVPPIWADRAAIVAAQARLASIFLPRAQRLAERIGMAWPQAFEDATRRHLEAELGLKF